MIECKFCGAEGLKWEEKDQPVMNMKYHLVEPDGEIHKCSLRDRKKLKDRLDKEYEEMQELKRKHREANGYL